MTDATTSGPALYRAIYTAVPGSNPEYAQGAIERNELAHREIEHFVWLIEVPEPATAGEWETRLNSAVAPENGVFRVEEATADDRRRLAAGDLALQK